MRRRRELTESERAIWAQVAGTARPLRPPVVIPPQPARHDDRPPARAAPLRAPDPPRPVATPLRPAGAAEPALRWRAPADDAPRPIAPRTPGIDDGTSRRMRRGAVAPQARLDLHGMTADRAHAALARFLDGAAAQGLRVVLVITGKGGGAHGGRGDGLLKRETPRWLAAAPLAHHVVGVFEAHARHGGAGALYVYLRRRR